MNDETIVIGLKRYDKEAISVSWHIYFDKVYPFYASVFDQGRDAVRGGFGCKWLAAVFSENPLLPDVIIRTLETVKRGDEKSGCRSKAAVPGARTVLIRR